MSEEQTLFAGIYAPDQRWLDGAEPEPVFEPDLPIVDAHLHLWEYDGYRYFLQEHAADLDAHLEAANGRFRGIRQRAKWDPDPRVRGTHHAEKPGLYLDPAFARGMDALAARGLSFDASVFHPQIAEVAALARSHPNVTIILNHCGSPVGHGAYAGREKETYAAWLACASWPSVPMPASSLVAC